ncbi:MAG: hypothetical protein WDM78_19865 [Puia sp.]
MQHSFRGLQNNIKKGAEVAQPLSRSLSAGINGIIKWKECSTHWLMANEFREMFPEVTLVDGRVVTEQNGLYSSGGATSYWSLLLHLVEKYAGRDMAIMASKIYALEIDRKSQSPFIMFNGQKEHVDEPIREAQDILNPGCRKRISVGELALKFAIGRPSF